MKKKFAMALGLMAAFTINGLALAASPLPQFEKEAIEDTYRRTGDQEPKIEDKNDGLSKEHLGNTGTKENPAFYVKKIVITGEPVEDKFGELAGIIASYERKSLDLQTMRQLQADVTKFVRDRGYTVCQAVIPPQEIKNGELEVRIYIARYDKITRIPVTEDEKKYDIADRVIDKYVSQIQPGQLIRDVRLEKTLNRLNDLPGVQARASLKPGSLMGTTSLDIDVERRPVWSNYVFVDNAGSRSTGRYRYGFYTEYVNPGRNGDKIGVSGMTSNGDLYGGSIRYEGPVGYRGTRMGVALSLTDYDSKDDLSGYGWFDTKGRSAGLSYYGFTPLYRDKRSRVHAIWGYDYRNVKDKYTNDEYIRLMAPVVDLQESKRHSHVGHVGFNGSEYENNRFTSYSVTYWFGNTVLDSSFDPAVKSSPHEGFFHKGTADFTHIKFDRKANYRVNLSAQIASKNIDSSERFYIGGMNSVRAYAGSTFTGDNGFYWCGEVRHQIGGIKGLEAAAFFEGADAGIKGADGQHRTLQGWGLGLRYREDNNWHAQLDYGRKFRRESGNAYDQRDSSMGRWWIQVYKMF